MQRKIKYVVLFVFVGLIVACKPEVPQPSDDTSHLKNGFLVLNEGLFQLNNASMSWIDLTNGTVNNQIFEERTGRQLGDTGNDMLVYGAKLYVVTSVSSTLEVLEAKTLKPIKQMAIEENGTPQQPQNLTAINGKIYFSTFAGKVWCVDTTNLEVATKIEVGLNPDRIANDGQYIYVSNSGGLNYPTYDSTISVINPVNNMEIKKIVTDTNPGEIVAAADGNVYVLTRGNYSDVPFKMHKINTSTLTKDTTYSLEVAHLIPYSSAYLIIGYTNESGKEVLAKFNMATQKIEVDNFIDISTYSLFYGIQYLPKKFQFALKDANAYTNSGKVLIYSATGSLLATYSVGLNPNKIIYYE